MTKVCTLAVLYAVGVWIGIDYGATNEMCIIFGCTFWLLCFED